MRPRTLFRLPRYGLDETNESLERCLLLLLLRFEDVWIYDFELHLEGLTIALLVHSELNIIPGNFTSSQQENRDIAETLEIIPPASGHLGMGPNWCKSTFTPRGDTILVRTMVILFFYVIFIKLLCLWVIGNKEHVFVVVCFFEVYELRPQILVNIVRRMNRLNPIQKVVYDPQAEFSILRGNVEVL